ncbi:putative quinol monooxygenase [Vagococcus silagei]|uniref:Antibiotic biosynthesis monooxygenase n=1 Tax=Vagococcus silagei TaxID=2508885 RepID=A0A4S3B4Y8_9ENTE|nr:putative quinol monooxygenase [Vagococcus silagei]THB61548.1 antibiotic biosynthesis monooxygenase [Vagococcus silagei]
MLYIIAEDFIHPDKIQAVLPLYHELVELTQQEQGCLSYELTHDLKDEGHFLFLEKWETEVDLDHHISSEHFQRLVPEINTYTRLESRFTRMLSFKEME